MVLAKGSHVCSEAEKGMKVAILESVPSKWQNGSIINNRLVLGMPTVARHNSQVIYEISFLKIFRSYNINLILCPFQQNKLALSIYLEHVVTLLFFKIWWHPIAKKYWSTPIYVTNVTHIYIFKISVVTFSFLHFRKK